MKRLFLALFASFALAAPAFAIVGGPWDGNVPGNPNTVNPSDINGTYQGTIKGKNLAGVLTFSTSTTGTSFTGSTTTTTAVVTGSGASQRTTWTYETSPGTYPGYALVFIEGGIGIAGVDVSVQLGARKMAGVIDGATGVPATFTISTTNSNAQTSIYTVVDNVSFAGAFSAKLSNWASNSFSGKGTLAVRKFDLDAFNADAASDPSALADAFDTTNGVDYIRTVYTPIKVSGAKASDEAVSYEISIPAPTDPTITFEAFK